MMKTREEKQLVEEMLIFSARCLEETNRGVKNSGRALKKLSDLKEHVLDTYRSSEISYETFRTLDKILNNAIDTIETTLWYYVD